MIYTKIAKIVGPTTVILAAGSENGVKEGMEFVIYDLTDTIRDPDTGDDLGRLEIVKGQVYAVHVQDKITLARTKSRTVQRIDDPMAMVGASLAGRLTRRTATETVWDELKIAEPTGPSFIASDRVVRVGDKVRSVYQPEFALTEAAK